MWVVLGMRVDCQTEWHTTDNKNDVALPSIMLKSLSDYLIISSILLLTVAIVRIPRLLLIAFNGIFVEGRSCGTTSSTIEIMTVNVKGTWDGISSGFSMYQKYVCKL